MIVKHELEVPMFKALFLTMFISITAFAQLRQGTESCLGAAMKIAMNKIPRDSKTKNSVLNKMGFLADSCVYSSKSKAIVCVDAVGAEQFEVEFNESYIKNRNQAYTEMAFQFVTGTQGLNIYYVIYLVKGRSAKSCSYVKTSVFTKRTED